METPTDKRAEKVEVAIEELKDSAPSDDGAAVVLETEATVDGSLHDTLIEVPQEDVPAVAVALLNTDAGVAPADDNAPPAVRCLGAGVVHWLDERTVRIHLQFDSGQVLPVEMSKEAALALCRGLFERTGAATDFDPARWGVAAGPPVRH
jgi:hypothetical protein